MDLTRIAVSKMLKAFDAPAYDVGVLSQRGILPGLTAQAESQVLSKLALLKAHNARNSHIYIRPSGEHRFTVLDDLTTDALSTMVIEGYEPCVVVETSPNNFQAWLKHDDTYPARLSTFVAQTLAERFHGDPSAADWRRFGRLPGFTNCKPKYRKPNGLFPFVLLREATGVQYTRAAFLRLELTMRFQLREQERQRHAAERAQLFASQHRGRRFSHLSLDRFRTSPRYSGRPAAADMAFCVAALSLAMPENEIVAALNADYLSRDPNPRRKAAYIERTLTKARAWAQR